jgi:hypothetical protein
VDKVSHATLLDAVPGKITEGFVVSVGHGRETHTIIIIIMSNKRMLATKSRHADVVAHEHDISLAYIVSKITFVSQTNKSNLCTNW